MYRKLHYEIGTLLLSAWKNIKRIQILFGEIFKCNFMIPKKFGFEIFFLLCKVVPALEGYSFEILNFFGTAVIYRRHLGFVRLWRNFLKGYIFFFIKIFRVKKMRCYVRKKIFSLSLFNKAKYFYCFYINPKNFL